MPDDVTLTGAQPPAIEDPLADVTPVLDETAPASITPDAEEPHPLEPGGDRFKEVWARAKKAEAGEKVEREARIRAEERAKVLEEIKTAAAPANTQPEYGWDQLQKWIDAGQITMAQALDYREKRVAERVVSEAQVKTRHELIQQQRTAFVDGEIGKFIHALPTIHDLASPERQRAEREFAYLLTVDGIDSPTKLDADTTKRYQLKALRAAFGDPAAITSAHSAEREARANRETFMEHASSGTASSSSGKDPLKGIDARTREHYERMIKNGRYRDQSGKKSSWDLVREELATADKYAQRNVR